MSYFETMTPEDAFQRYEDIRHRLPTATCPMASQNCDSLLDIADQFDAFLLDSFGVLNVGERAIPGAVDCITKLRALGKHLIVLTNAASYTRQDAMRRYTRLGFDFTDDEVVSSRDVATARLEQVAPGAVWGAIAAPADRFEDIDAEVHHWDAGPVDAFLMLSSVALTSELYNALKAELQRKPRPIVIANPDLVAPRETGLSKEPGFYAQQLCDDLGVPARFFGKPFGDAFADALSRLPDIPRHRVAMVGDTLHTDILGGRAAGCRTVLIRDHGLFAGLDVTGYVERSGLIPDFQSGSI